MRNLLSNRCVPYVLYSLSGRLCLSHLDDSKYYNVWTRLLFNNNNELLLSDTGGLLCSYDIKRSN